MHRSRHRSHRRVPPSSSGCDDADRGGPPRQNADGSRAIDLGLASVGAPFQDAQDARFTPDLPERRHTQLGEAIGTPLYLPPEAGQCPAEPRLDVYALGVTLYQLCTQTLPHATGVPPIREVCPGSDAPDDLSRLLAAALAPDVSERLSSADHLRRGLEAILTAHPRQGARHLFGGSFDRLEVLGIGASAVVFRASDRWLSREVAVKILRDAGSEGDAIRFRRAAKVLSALHHPNIPRILHFGLHEAQCYAVTELCPGAPATSVVRPDHHLRPDETIAVGLQLAGALAAVHAAGVVYRDLHPGNVLIARSEPLRASIFDFDQAQVSPEFYAALTERWATPPEARAEPQHEKPLRNMDYAAPEVRAGAAFLDGQRRLRARPPAVSPADGEAPVPRVGRRPDATAQGVPRVPGRPRRPAIGDAESHAGQPPRARHDPGHERPGERR
jgi:serine/threonine protein kinase